MKRNTSLSILAAVGITALLLQTAAFASVVVYDNTTTATTGPFIEATEYGFWPFSQYNAYDLVGDSVNLDPGLVERTVCRFDLMLSCFPWSQPVTLPELTVSFYDLDAPWPDTEIWSSVTLTNVVVDGLTMVTFDVSPGVTVDDSFVWTACADSLEAGLATFDPPEVGSSDDYFFVRDFYDLSWCALNFDGDPVANFGARIWAVPEPASALVMVLGGLLACRPGRRRGRRARP